MASSRVEVGPTAPVFALPDQNGKQVSLSDFAGSWVVLYFYPKDDTPGCTTEACEFTDGIEAFERLDAVVLGCTEIPLIMNDANSLLPTLDSTRLLARAALRHAVQGEVGPG